MKRFISLLLLSLSIFVGNAYLINNVYYLPISGTNKVEISDVTYQFSGTLVIPSKISAPDGNYNVVGIKDNALDWKAFVTGVVFPSTNFKIGYASFKRTGIKTLTIPETITEIGPFAFGNCEDLVSVTMADNIEVIPYLLFSGCSSLRNVKFSNSLKTIGEKAFSGTALGSELRLPASVTTIHYLAFEYCQNLQNLIIGEKIKSIGNKGDYSDNKEGGAFLNCNNLRSVTVLSPTPPKTYYSTYPNFSNYDIPLFVPEGSEDLYRKADEWSKFKLINPVLANQLSIQTVTLDGDREKHKFKSTEEFTLVPVISPGNASVENFKWNLDADNVFDIIADNGKEGLVLRVKDGVSEQNVRISCTLSQISNLGELTSDYYLSVSERMPGDVNDNKIVNVADVVSLGNKIIGGKVDSFCFANADVNADNKISTADVTGTVDIILNDVDLYTLLKAKRHRAQTTADLLVSDSYAGGESQAEIGVRFEGERPYSALQATLMVPQGMRVTDIVAGAALAGHTVLFNEAAPGVVKIIIFSFANTEFNSEDAPLFYILADTRNAVGNIEIVDILGSDMASNEYELGFAGGMQGNISTGIASVAGGNVVIRTVAGVIEVLNAEGQAINVYRFTGETAASVLQASSFEEIRLHPGMYIVKVGESAAKVIVK